MVFTNYDIPSELLDTNVFHNNTPFVSNRDNIKQNLGVGSPPRYLKVQIASWDQDSREIELHSGLRLENDL